MSTLQFYHRNECHLCEDMWAGLLELQKQYGFVLESIDIDATTELKARYGDKIPVLAAGEKILCNYYLDPVSLQAFLNLPGD